VLSWACDSTWQRRLSSIASKLIASRERETACQSEGSDAELKSLGPLHEVPASASKQSEQRMSYAASSVAHYRRNESAELSCTWKIAKYDSG